MELDEYVDSLADRLKARGLRRLSSAIDGPMGSGEIAYASNGICVAFYSDRGLHGVAVGPSDGPRFNARVWATLLGVPLGGDATLDAQIAFLLSQLDNIRTAVALDPGIVDKLRDANWTYVRKELHVPPDMPRPGAGKIVVAALHRRVRHRSSEGSLRRNEEVRVV